MPDGHRSTSIAWRARQRCSGSSDELAWRASCKASCMSKHNVNPGHYKVAGRERQGEDILQERNKQKLAQSVVRERFEVRQAAPAGASPAGPSTFPAPSVANARQESGSSDETPLEPGGEAASSRRAAAPARRPTAAARSGKGASTAKKRSGSSTKTGAANTKTRSRTAAKRLSRATARKSAVSGGKKAASGVAKKPSGSRPKSTGGAKKRAGAAASRRRTTRNR